jgi:WD40 repeat protein
VAFSADGRNVVSGSEDQTLRRWNADAGTEIGPAIEGHRDEVVAVAYLSHGERIVSASSDGTVRYWNSTTGRQIGPSWLNHDFAVSGLAVAPDESEILAATVDGLVHRLPTPSGAVKAMCELLGDAPVRSSNLGLAAGAVACSAN